MPDAAPALSPVHPYGGPGESITLHDGPVTYRGQSKPGRVELRLSPETEVAWLLEGADGPSLGSVDLTLQLSAEALSVGGECNRSSMAESAGYLRETEVGARDAAMRRVLVHWLNLPQIRSPGVIRDAANRTTYAGRWHTQFGKWAVTLDRRADYGDVWAHARQAGSIVMTHVMAIELADSRAFTAEEIEPVLDALQLGISFAVGRWVSPALPVGLDSDGLRVWERWSADLCTPGAPGTLRWWPNQRQDDLAELLELLVGRFEKPDERFTMRFLLGSGVQSAAGGLVEQRIMTAFAAIEHLMWTRLVKVGGMSKTKYGHKDFNAHEKLAMVLDEAGIEQGIDENLLPGLRAAAQLQPPDRQTGPVIACRIRNMIVHPTDHEVELYRRDNKLVQQAWLLTQHYLVLLVLHHLGYRGHSRLLIAPGGWASDVAPMPWAT
jgi:hypothetical protein